MTNRQLMADLIRRQKRVAKSDGWVGDFGEGIEYANNLLLERLREYARTLPRDKK